MKINNLTAAVLVAATLGATAPAEAGSFSFSPSKMLSKVENWFDTNIAAMRTDFSDPANRYRGKSVRTSNPDKVWRANMKTAEELYLNGHMSAYAYDKERAAINKQWRRASKQARVSSQVNEARSRGWTKAGFPK